MQMHAESTFSSFVMSSMTGRKHAESTFSSFVMSSMTGRNYYLGPLSLPRNAKSSSQVPKAKRPGQQTISMTLKTS